MDPASDWCFELRKILELAKWATALLTHFGGSEAREAIDQLLQIRAFTRDAFERCSARSSANVVLSRPLTQEESYLAAAMLAPGRLPDKLGFGATCGYDDYRALKRL